MFLEENERVFDMSLVNASVLSEGVVFCVLTLAFLAAAQDLFHRKISNRLILVFLLTGLVLGTLAGGASWLLAALIMGGIVCISLFPLFSFGALGAGDVKLFAAIGALLGLEAFMPIFFISLVVGGAIGAGIWWKYGDFDGADEQDAKQIDSGDQKPSITRSKTPSVPFGVAIAIASFLGVFGAEISAVVEAWVPWMANLRIPI